jgi:hypothetical protein
MLQIAFTQHLHFAYKSSTNDWKEILPQRRPEALGASDDLRWERWKASGENSGLGDEVAGLGTVECG